MAFDPDWPHGHVTEDGRKARIICKDVKHKNYSMLALVTEKDGYEIGVAYRKAGNAVGYGFNYDLYNAPAPKQKLELWINLYSHGGYSAYQSREFADNHNRDRIACKHIVVEEGEGLE